MEPMVTIFKNIFSKEPHYISVDNALERIRVGKSRTKIEEIRACLDKEKSGSMKMNLPSVCFSGKFVERKDDKILCHSGFIVLDFDNLTDVRDTQTEIISNPFVFACWVSPSGNGLKALVRIADGTKHREHFQALQEVFPEVDKSGINESRVCYESYDPEIYINKQAQVFKKIKSVSTEKIQEKNSNDDAVFEKIMKWITNRGDAFVRGDRNNFIFKLASACCRFGIYEEDAANSIANALNFAANNFPDKEAYRTISSAYRANKHLYASAEFKEEILVTKIERKEVDFNDDFYNLNVKAKDVIYGEDVKDGAVSIFDNGYERVLPFEIELIDRHFKLKEGEITLLTGIGNYGKSSFLMFLLLMRAVVYGDKFAFFSPESNPAEEFYHDIVEMLAGENCEAKNSYRETTRESYEMMYDWVCKHFFFVYPKEIAPTPDYIKERFLELIVKEKVSGCVIDPFNQLANNYSKTGGNVSKYLEYILTDFKRFAETNKQYFIIVAHPKIMQKQGDNYPCPDVFDVNDGAMWNNKMDNILVYHRPLMQSNPDDPTAEFHAKKIRRQKVVGVKGWEAIQYNRKFRRFYFDGSDVLQKAMNEKGLFETRQKELEFEEAPF